MRNIVEALKRIIENNKVVFVIYCLMAIIASIQLINADQKTFGNGEELYEKYNNYVIFKTSNTHLIEGDDLYAEYPDEHWDLYKYSPTFAAFFGVFAIFPDWLGLTLWSLLNVLVLFAGIYYLPKLSQLQKGLIAILCLPELVTSIQNQQSNVLIAGLIILAFAWLEHKKYFWAIFLIMFSVFIKLFGLVAFALLLFYPKKFRLAYYTVLSILILAILPLLFIGFEDYQQQLLSFFDMLSNDFSESYGYSVMGWLNTWFGWSINKLLVVACGVIIFMLPFYKFKSFQVYDLRFLTMTSILIWVVIFNHKAESPTFIIAMSGVVLWFIYSEKTKINITLFILAFIFTGLVATDLFPKSMRQHFLEPYAIKVVPCIIIWVKIIYDMMRVQVPSIELESKNKIRS